MMRVEIKLAELTALAAVVLVLRVLGLLCRRLSNETVGAVPPLRPVVVSPARKENKYAHPPRTNVLLRSFSPAPLFEGFL
jgi:hypothetical protein